MKTAKNLFLTLAINLVVSSSFATNLLDAYNAALANDPQFKIARSTWLADRENFAISRASLLPQIATRANVARSREKLAHGGGVYTPAYYGNSLGYGLTISQSIFDFKKLASLWGSQAIVRRAHAVFMAEEEGLLYRVAERYFDVLLAKSFLSHAQAQRQANEHLFVQSKHKYDVGIIPITDLAESRRNYERSLAIEVKSKTDLDSALEKLAEITGARYRELDSLGSKFPLMSPQPKDMEQWVRAAEQRNFDLMAYNYQTIYAWENLKAKHSGHFPTVNVQGSYGYGYNSNYGNSGNHGRTKSASVGMELTMPLFSGGGTVAEAKQAHYHYQVALGELDKKHREVVSSTRQAYLGVISGISAIRADLEAIRAAESTLKSMRANYSVGRKTMSDVLDAQSKLYETQTEYARDEHSYILLLLKLKMCTGSLVVDDLWEVNSWLEDKISTAKKLQRENPRHSKNAAGNGTITKKIKSKSTKVKAQNGSSASSQRKIKIFRAEAIEPAVAL